MIDIKVLATIAWMRPNIKFIDSMWIKCLQETILQKYNTYNTGYYFTIAGTS